MPTSKLVAGWLAIMLVTSAVHAGAVIELTALTPEIPIGGYMPGATVDFQAAITQDTGADIRARGLQLDFTESDPALKEIVKLLANQNDLKLFVVGHPDSVGAFDYNMNLSQKRAEAVVEVLVSRYSVARDRVKAHGVGPLVPTTSNRSDDGRAKNRRVELVEQ